MMSSRPTIIATTLLFGKVHLDLANGLGAEVLQHGNPRNCCSFWLLSTPERNATPRHPNPKTPIAELPSQVNLRNLKLGVIQWCLVCEAALFKLGLFWF